MCGYVNLNWKVLYIFVEEVLFPVSSIKRSDFKSRTTDATRFSPKKSLD